MVPMGIKKKIKLKLSWSCYLIRVCCITRWKKIQYYRKGIIRFYIRPKSQNYLYFEIFRSWFGPALLIIKGKAQMWIYMTEMGKRHDWTTPWSNGPGNASSSLSPIKCIQNAHCLYNHAMDCPTTAQKIKAILVSWAGLPTPLQCDRFFLLLSSSIVDFIMSFFSRQGVVEIKALSYQ